MRISIIGAGDIAIHHLNVLSNINGVKIVGICNRSGKGLDQIKQKYNIPVSTTDWRELVKLTTPDAIFILVSPDNIFSVAHECLKSGIPCFLEKPAGLSLEESTELLNIATRSRCLHMIGLNRRFYSSINTAINFVNYYGDTISGALIEDHQPISLLKRKGKHSSQVLERWLFANGVHAIDLIRHIFGEISNLEILKTSRTETNGDGISFHAKAGNSLITYVADWHSGQPQRLSLFGRDASAILGKNYLEGTLIRNGKSTNLELTQIDRDFKPGLYMQSKTFIEGLEAGTIESCNLHDYLKTAQIVDKVFKSPSK